MFQLGDVVTTYESLGKEEKNMVPHMSFENSNSYLEVKRESSEKISENHTTDSKN